MITVDQLPEKAIDAARLAMAIALADDGDGVLEAIVAAINAWPGGHMLTMVPQIILPVQEPTHD